MKAIDLNLDAAEDPASLTDGREERLYRLVTRVNIACGGHAGDSHTMSRAVDLAKEAGVLVGAHPGYPDRENFGRLPLVVDPREVTAFVRDQILALKKIAEKRGVALAHVKPHGALYHQINKDEGLARAVAEGVHEVDPQLVLVALAGSRACEGWRAAGFKVLGEGFADRSYRADGTLVPRGRPDALIADPEIAARQALRLYSEGKAETISIHGDSPQAEAILLEIQRNVL